MVRDETRAFAASAAHDLRTPLAVIAGEVELALRRERSPNEYRDALARIGERVTEALELTEDLGLLAETSMPTFLAARLDLVLGSLAARYRKALSAPKVSVPAPTGASLVIGDERLIERALRLLVEHAVRHGSEAALVTLREATPESSAAADALRLTLQAAPRGFAHAPWQHLTVTGIEETLASAPGLLRLRTTAHIVQGYGGAVDLKGPDGAAWIEIRLQRAATGVMASTDDVA